MSLHSAAIQVLKEAGKPLHAKEITKKIIAEKLWLSEGKTPEATVSARLYSDIKKNGDTSVFVKVAPQTFVLRDVQIVSEARASEPSPEKEPLSFLDAAEQVLSQYANGQPMHYRDITEKALECGWLSKGAIKEAACQYAQIVDATVANDCNDIHLIEQTLDGLLNFAFADSCLLLLKKLCRHYYGINPQAAAEYVLTYREMWDEEKP